MLYEASESSADWYVQHGPAAKPQLVIRKSQRKFWTNVRWVYEPCLPSRFSTRESLSERADVRFGSPGRRPIGRLDFGLNDCRLTITPVFRDRLPSRADWTTIPGVYRKARPSLFPARARDRKFPDRATPFARRAGSSSRAPSIA